MTHHHGFATIAKIKEEHEDALRKVLKHWDQDQHKISMKSLTTVHFASWVILSEAPLKPARLLLETNYDGELDAHLDDLLKHGAAAFDAVYTHCEDYPAVTPDAERLKQVKQFLIAGEVPSSAYYVAFPRASLRAINNAIAVYEEAQTLINDDLRRPYSYVDPDGHQQTVPSGFEKVPPSVVQDALVHHFRSSRAQNHPDRPAPPRWLQWIFNGILAYGRAIFEGIFLLLPLGWFCERREAWHPRAVTDDSTQRRDTDAKIYPDLDRGLHNHLCTFKTVKRSDLRLFILKQVLSIVSFFSRKVFLFSRLGQLSTIHFAKWIVLDDEKQWAGKEQWADRRKKNDKQLLFVSNYDGSFTNYLGDFSELAWYGLNPIWSNTIGFPPTRGLIGRGATDLDRFEEVDRLHFYPAQLFYSAYHKHSVQTIRRYLDFSAQLARDMAAAAKKERRRWRAVERLERRGNCTVERHDLQGIVVSGYLHCRYARYLFLEICDPAETRKWLAAIVGMISTAERRESFEAKPQTHLNIALTHGGLKKLGLPEETLEQFPYEFIAGMNRPEAARMLGDTGSSAQAHWQFGNVPDSGSNPLHMMILLFATSETGLDSWETSVLGNPAPFRILHRIDSVSDDDRNEPFGFRDGISQPNVLSLMKIPPARTDDIVRPGDFVLGYQNEHDKESSSPSIAKLLDGGKYPLDRRHYLPAHPADSTNLRSFGVNGSFLVARKLSQRVDEFWQFAARESLKFDGSSDPERRELLAARLMGRWRSGAPLLLTGDRDIPILGRLSLNNDFRYNKADANGSICPLGAHIRRSNPRDDVKLRKPAVIFKLRHKMRAESMRLSKRHRIIRRGRRYHEPVNGAPVGTPHYDQGILFIAINTDPHRQFEFMQQTWLNSPTFQGLDNDKDAVVGDNDGVGGFTVQNDSANQRASGLPRFVTVKGGGYFFLPGINAVRFLANMIVTPSDAEVSIVEAQTSHAS